MDKKINIYDLVLFISIIISIIFVISAYFYNFNEGWRYNIFIFFASMGILMGLVKVMSSSLEEE